jgi:hypothetical protein
VASAPGAETWHRLIDSAGHNLDAAGSVLDALREHVAAGNEPELVTGTGTSQYALAIRRSYVDGLLSTADVMHCAGRMQACRDRRHRMCTCVNDCGAESCSGVKSG